MLKPADYREDGEVEASSPYEAWLALRRDGRDLRVGDVLQEENGQATICKYAGFEPAEWMVVDMEQQVAEVVPELRKDHHA